MHLLYFIVGCGLLVIASEAVIRGAEAVAVRYRIPSYLVAVVVISIGSDLPEFFIALHSSFESLKGRDSSGIIMGDAIGSAIAQGSLVLGAVSCFTYLQLSKRRARVHGSFLVLSVLLLQLLSLDGQLDRTDGLILLLSYAAYLVTALYMKSEIDKNEQQAASGSLWIPSLLLVTGFALMPFASEIIVKNLTALARVLDVSQTGIALLGIGLGTSLPELAISLRAVRLRKVNLALGNVIGSNIFDTLVIPGTAATITAVTVAPRVLYFDLPFLLALSLCLIVFLLRVKGIQKKEGLALLGFFTCFVVSNLYFLVFL